MTNIELRAKYYIEDDYDNLANKPKDAYVAGAVNQRRILLDAAMKQIECLLNIIHKGNEDIVFSESKKIADELFVL